MNGSVLVTGASSGIGCATARRLGADGAPVVLAARRIDRCAAIAEEIVERGGLARALALDLAAPEELGGFARQLDELTETMGPLQGVVHAAGTVDVHDALASGAERIWDEAFAVNLHGPRRLTERVLPSMLERGRGRIVAVASAAGLRGFPGIAAYAASKHALLGWLRCLAIELDVRTRETAADVSVAAVCPYYVATEMLEAAVHGRRAATGESREESLAHFRGRNPGGRLLEPDDVARVVCELLRAERRPSDERAVPRVVVLDGGPPRDLPEGMEPGLDVPLSPQSLA